jgi:hypothetical protein
MEESGNAAGTSKRHGRPQGRTEMDRDEGGDTAVD